jgi:hypothetical protein
MDCDKSHELLIGFIGGEITGPEAKEMKEHLQECSGCREELASLSRTRMLLRQAWPDEPIPQNLIFDFPGIPGRKFWGLWSRFGLARFSLATITVTSCLILCFSSLALLQTRLKVGEGGFAVSFGPSSKLPSGPADRAASSTTPLPVALDRREVENLIDRSVQGLEEKQRVHLEEILLQIESRRNADLRRIANELRVLESTQSVVYREAMNNQSTVESLARDFYFKVNAPASLSH